MRRFNENMRGERYLGNVHTKEVHDLDNEETNCQIDEIIAAGNGRTFSSLEIAHSLGYDNCAWCIGESTR